MERQLQKLPQQVYPNKSHFFIFVSYQIQISDISHYEHYSNFLSLEKESYTEAI